MKREARLALDQREELAPLDDDAAALLDRLHGGRARPAVERDFAEILAGADDVELHLAPLGIRDVDPRPPRDHEIERVGLVALVDDDGVLREGTHRRSLGDRLEKRGRQDLG